MTVIGSGGLKRSTARKILRATALTALLTILAGLASAQAAVFTANILGDAPDIEPGDGICATAQRTCSLRAAIQEANALEGEDIVILPSMPPPTALYDLTVSGPNEDDAATGDLDVTDDLIILGTGAGRITVDSTPTDRVFEIMENVNVTISGFMIQGGNAGTGNGGGILNRGRLILGEFAIRGCTAANGGAIANIGSAHLQLTNVTLSGNSAGSQGGALFNLNQATASLLNVTLASNTAGDAGAGVFNLVQPTATRPIPVGLQNTLLSHPGEAAGDCAGAPVTSLGHNLASTSTCFLNEPGDLQVIAAGLGPLQANGGRSLTHALNPGSPAIDAGSPTMCPGVDQREFLRPADGNGDQSAVCDIGAFEFGAASPTPTPTVSRTPTFSPTPTESVPPSATSTETATSTPTETFTAVPSPTPSATHTPSLTTTPTSTGTPTFTTSATRTSTIAPTPANSATPTSTATGDATATPTSTPAPRLTPTVSPSATATPAPARLLVSTARGAPGDLVSISVVLYTGGYEVSSASNELSFDPLNIPIARLANGQPDCLAAEGFGSAFRFRPPGCTGDACVRISASVLQLSFPLRPIPDGTVLYSCRVTIAATAPPATYPLIISTIVVADLQGERVVDAAGSDGSITVTVPCLGDCSGDGQVTVDEIVRMVNIALGLAAVATCPAADSNRDGQVTVDEIVAAVTRALSGCPRS